MMALGSTVLEWPAFTKHTIRVEAQLCPKQRCQTPRRRPHPPRRQHFNVQSDQPRNRGTVRQVPREKVSIGRKFLHRIRRKPPALVGWQCLNVFLYLWPIRSVPEGFEWRPPRLLTVDFPHNENSVRRAVIE